MSAVSEAGRANVWEAECPRGLRSRPGIGACVRLDRDAQTPGRGRLQTLAEMFDRAAEAFVEIHFWHVAQVLARFRDRCERVAHVARPWGVVSRLQVDAHDVRDASPQVANAGRRAAPDVEDFAGDLLRGRDA